MAVPIRAMDPRQRGYKQIADYGVIGNLRTAALVGLDGSIDWCCLPHLDSPSVFGAILDVEKGGEFRIGPAGPFRTSQHYLEETNVLATRMSTERGEVELVDCMPLRGEIDGCGRSEGKAELHRYLRGLHGEVEMELIWAPRFDYGRRPVSFERVAGGVVATDGKDLLTLGGVPGEVEEELTEWGPRIRARFSLQAGEEAAIVSRWASLETETSLEQTRGVIDQAVGAWRRWVRKPTSMGAREWAGPYREQVVRSELALKLLANADTGALAAAATTSLPETLGGVRNWDYRFAWIRDAAQIARVFFSLGHQEEVDTFIEWAEAISMSYGEEEEDLAILYPLRSETTLREEELEHLEGYKGSRPVRIGNAASRQLQLDIYGELIGAIHERMRLEHRFDRKFGPFLERVADEACRRWREPDFSIWEPRNGPLEFTYSKVMVWVALQRARELQEMGLVQGDEKRWRRTQGEIRQWVLERGFDPGKNSFVQRAGSDDLDAANLLIPIYGFLPVDDPRVQGTIDGVLRELTVNNLVYRYHAEDGLPGQEGAFVLCTFWLVDALILSGRLDEAGELYESLLGRTNHLGLLAEQIDPYTGEQLGNFPQAYSHIGMINSALYLARARKGV